MTYPKLRVAVIGNGMIANAAHIPAYRNLSDRVEIVAVADTRLQAAKETAARYGIPKWYEDPQQMLDEGHPDWVSVCTPNNYHKHWSIQALRAGAHVLCEKPIALRLQDAQEIYAEADRAGKLFFPCQSMRFSSDIQAAKKIFDSGRLGEVYFSDVEIIRRRGVPTWGMFHMKEHNFGGPFCDLGVHFLDSALYILGSPKMHSVSGGAFCKIANLGEDVETSLADSGAPAGTFTPRPYDYHEFDVEDFAAGSMIFENDMILNFKFSWAVNLPNGGHMDFAGDKGGMRASPLQIWTNLDGYQVDVKPHTFSMNQYQDVPFAGHWYMIEHIERCIRGEEEYLVKREEALNICAIIEAFYLSAEKKRPVLIEELGQMNKN